MMVLSFMHHSLTLVSEEDDGNAFLSLLRLCSSETQERSQGSMLHGSSSRRDGRRKRVQSRLRSVKRNQRSSIHILTHIHSLTQRKGERGDPYTPAVVVRVDAHTDVAGE